MTDLDKLEALAKAAACVRRDANGRLDGGDAHRLWHNFLDAANPATILHLIASARRDAEEIARALDLLNEARNGGFFIGTEAGPKVEEAKDVLRAYLARAAHTGEG